MMLHDCAQYHQTRLKGESIDAWWLKATLYQIFVRSFRDSNGDGIGDLNGVTSNLDYIKKLGATALWLNPIFPSPSYHGYNATDFRRIDPQLGDLRDFDRLIAEAHHRHIRVILDLALNHTSAQNPWFQSVLKDPKSPFRDFYVLSDHDPKWPGRRLWYPAPGNPGLFYYSYFGADFPELNWRNPRVLTEAENIMRFWAKRGVDGFRFDAIRHLVDGPHGELNTPENHEVIQHFAGDLKREFPQLYFLGEVRWNNTHASSYVNSGKEMDQAFPYPLALALRDAVRSDNPGPMLCALRETLSLWKRSSSWAPFLSNHDLDRLASVVGGDSAKLKMAAGLLLTLPGTPIVYYGEEIGMKDSEIDGDDPDPGRRNPMRWNEGDNAGFSSAPPWEGISNQSTEVSVAAEEKNPDSLLSTYRQLIHLRSAHPALQQGSLQLLDSPQSKVIAYLRKAGKEELLVLANFGDKSVENYSIGLNSSLPASPSASVSSIFGPGTVGRLDKANFRINRLMPHAVTIFSLGAGT